MNASYDYVFKILTIGESAVGKTCLLLRFTDNTFNTDFISTVGIDFKIQICKIKEKMVKLQVWDTSGQERFKTITKTYYKGGDGILLVYDVTDRSSFMSLKNWMRQIELNAKENVPKIMVGNKCDKTDRKVTYEEGEKVAKDFGVPFMETSAKEDINVNEVFKNLTIRIMDQYDKLNINKDDKQMKDRGTDSEIKLVSKANNGCKNCNC